MKIIFFFCAVFILPSWSRKLRPTFKRCDVKSPNFNECLTEAVPDAVRQLKKPIRRMGLPSMEPLVIPALSIQYEAGSTDFEKNYTDMKVSGFTGISCSKIELDFEGKNMIMNCSFPQIKVESDYFINGTIVVMPIYGNGTATITLDQVRCFHRYEFDEYYKKGKKHFRVTNGSLDINPSLVTIKYDNLYDGDKFLGENMNLVMNDNWREIYRDLKPSYDEGFFRVFKALFNSVLARVPVSDIFING